MQPYFRDVFGNPSSVHRAGQKAREALDVARRTVSEAIGAGDSEIVFTSGGTESDFLALAGILTASGKKRLVTTGIEHHAVLHTCELLREWGFGVDFVRPAPDGRVRASDVLGAVRPDTGLVSVMWVNNETGAVQPIDELARELEGTGVSLHADAVQALGVQSIDVQSLPVSSLSFSGHKIFGPKGIGALYLRKGTPFKAILRGGAQERNRRAGTENVAGAAGFAKAVELAVRDRERRNEQVGRLRDRFLERLASAVDGVERNAFGETVPGIVNLRFRGVRAETLLMALDLRGVAASSGSACTSGSLEPSHVLQAMGLSEDEVLSSVRFSFSSLNHTEEVDRAVEIIARSVEKIRG